MQKQKDQNQKQDQDQNIGCYAPYAWAPFLIGRSFFIQGRRNGRRTTKRDLGTTVSRLDLGREGKRPAPYWTERTTASSLERNIRRAKAMAATGNDREGNRYRGQCAGLFEPCD